MNTIFTPSTQQKENARTFFELWKTLEGNARSYDPVTGGMKEVVVTENIETQSKKGNPMRRVKLREIETGREAVSYLMNWKPDFTRWEDIEPLTTVRLTIDLKDGFYNLGKPDITGSVESIPQRPNKPNGPQYLIIYDIEVFEQDFVICARDLFSGKRWEIANDLDKAREWYLEVRDSLFTGYNSASYDNNVLRGYLQGKDAFQLSQAVIKSDDRGLIYKLFNTKKTPILGCDLYHEHKGFSLKEHEGFMGLEVKETDVDFEQGGKLTDDELQKEIDYCWKDVEATELRFYGCVDGLLAKAFICAMFNLDKQAFNQTNANLVAQLMGANRPKSVRDDLIEPFTLPENLNLTIPEIREMFLEHEFELNKKGKPIAKGTYTDPKTGYVMKFGAGGVHGAVEQLIHIGRFLMRDYGSLYPNTYVNFDVLSRNVPSKNKHLVKELLDKRLEAKYTNETEITMNGATLPMYVLVNGVKLPLNTLFGATGAEFNGLYDPRYQFLTCVIGQLIMSDFYEGIRDHVTMLQSNTDCHAYIPHDEEAERITDAFCDDISKRVGIVLDKDEFIALYQKDVNNYIGIDSKGKVKVKGAITLTNGLKYSKAVVSNAFINYVVSGVDYKQSIGECTDLRQFQIITKTGWTFDRTVYIDAEGNEHDAQKVNRVFAVNSDEKAVKLFKVKTGKLEAVENEDDEDEIENEQVSYVKGNDSYVSGLNNPPEFYTISNERIGEGVQLDEIDLSYYEQEVERTLVLWFGDNWKERLEEAHNEYKEQYGTLPEAKQYV